MGYLLRCSTRGNHLNNSPRFSPVDLYSLGREESGLSVLCLCSCGWSRALSGWMTMCQAKAENQKNGETMLQDTK